MHQWRTLMQAGAGHYYFSSHGCIGVYIYETPSPSIHEICPWQRQRKQRRWLVDFTLIYSGLNAVAYARTICLLFSRPNAYLSATDLMVDASG